MYSTLIETINANDLEFDFYINPHKLRNIHAFEIADDLCGIEFSVEVHHTEEETIGGDWDERFREYTETSREINLLNAYNHDGDEIKLTKPEKNRIESAIDDRLTLKLY